MPDSKLISDEMQATINKILHGTDISEIAEQRPEISMEKRVRMMVLLIVQAMNSEVNTLTEWLNNTRKKVEEFENPTLESLIAREMDTRALILDHFDCATETDIEILPMFNFIVYYCRLDDDQTVAYSENEENLIEAENEYYDKYWKAGKYTLVRAFWQTTDDVLMVFENKREIA